VVVTASVLPPVRATNVALLTEQDPAPDRAAVTRRVANVPPVNAPAPERLAWAYTESAPVTDNAPDPLSAR
jgi:hypothetical protein